MGDRLRLGLRVQGDRVRGALRGSVAARGRFDLLGFRDLSFGDPIDWLADPVADRRSPSVHWSRVPFLNYESVGDHKVVWELNRHQYLAALGQAYWYTGRDAYAATFAEHVGAWMDANPPKLVTKEPPAPVRVRRPGTTSSSRQ